MKKIVLNLLLVLSTALVWAQRPAGLPIGVFDSGTGGLTVLEAILTLDAFNNKTGKPGSDGQLDFSEEYFQYLADQANMPYGNYAAENKTDLLKEHILGNIRFLINKKYSINNEGWQSAAKPPVKMVVVACNTATAYALSDIKQYLEKQETKVPCIGVIDAGSKAALQYQVKHGEGAIGVFATAGTVASDGYPRTLRSMAKDSEIKEPLIVSQGGFGLAESIDRDWDYYVDTLQRYRKDYKGPSVKNSQYKIDITLLSAYNFDTTANKLLCELDDKGNCLDMQLNDPSNYVRYHLVSLLEKMLAEKINQPLNTLILGCTHYPFLKNTIQNVLKELYNFKQNNQYKYRTVLAKEVGLIDPGVETAKEAYIALQDQDLKNTGDSKKNQFFISVPNTDLKEIKLQEDGWFTYQYKYGRKAGEQKEYIKIVEFDQKNVSSATYDRIKAALPGVYKQITASQLK